MEGQSFTPMTSSFATSSGCDYTTDNKTSTNLSRRSVDWRDSGIVIDEDQHQFNSFDPTSGISSYFSSSSSSHHYNFQPTLSSSSSILSSTSSNLTSPIATAVPANCCPIQRIAYDQDDDGDTILHLAVVGCHLDKVRDLIKICDLNTINNMMQTPLHVAVLANRPEMVQLLMNSNARLDVHDRRGNTPLHLACQKGHQEIIEILLSEEAVKCASYSVQQRIELTNFDGQTCLHLAASNDRRQLIELLVNKFNANLNCRDSKSGETIMHKAIVRFNVDLVAFILGLDKHCNTADYSGREPLDTIQILKESRINQDQMQKLVTIDKLVRDRIQLCIQTGGCCFDRLQNPARAKDPLDSMETSSSDFSDSDYELN